MAAARFGHHMIIKILLTKFKPDLEQEGVVKFDGYVIEGATALWCAACAGKTCNCHLIDWNWGCEVKKCNFEKYSNSSVAVIAVVTDIPKLFVKYLEIL